MEIDRDKNFWDLIRTLQAMDMPKVFKVSRPRFLDRAVNLHDMWLPERWPSGSCLVWTDPRHHFDLVDIGTADRLVYAEHREAIANVMTAHGYDVNSGSSWKWESNGDDAKRKYVPIYLLCGRHGVTNTRVVSTCPTCHHESSEYVDIPHEPLIRLDTVCLSKDPRADRCIFELLDDLGHHIDNGGYKWTVDGLTMSFCSKKDVEGVKAVFPDCKVELVKLGHGQYELTVHFPG
jgi:hypothetical protein